MPKLDVQIKEFDIEHLAGEIPPNSQGAKGMFFVVRGGHGHVVLTLIELKPGEKHVHPPGLPAEVYVDDNFANEVAFPWRAELKMISHLALEGFTILSDTWDLIGPKVVGHTLYYREGIVGLQSIVNDLAADQKTNPGDPSSPRLFAAIEEVYKSYVMIPGIIAELGPGANARFATPEEVIRLLAEGEKEAQPSGMAGLAKWDPPPGAKPN